VSVAGDHFYDECVIGFESGIATPSAAGGPALKALARALLNGNAALGGALVNGGLLMVVVGPTQ